VAVAVGDPFAVEDVAGRDELALEIIKLGGIERGNARSVR
jgi:hypothetical protein